MGQYSLIRGKALRVTRLNGCGNPVLGPDSQISTDGFITIGMTSNTEAGTTITVTNANGDLCVQDQPSPRLVNITAEIALCGVDPELVGMLTGQPLVLNAAGDEVVGFRQNTGVNVDLTGFALETWTGVSSDVCSDEGTPEYGYFLLPFLKGGILGNITVQNGSIDFTITGATTKDGTGWGVGPYDVTRDEAGLEGPLNETLDTKDHFHLEVVTVSPPEPSDGAEAVGVPATLITAGTPATLSPANSYAPLNLAAIIASGVTKTPTSAWTTGQRVVLRDGSYAHWSGSAWVAGAA